LGFWENNNNILWLSCCTHTNYKDLVEQPAIIPLYKKKKKAPKNVKAAERKSTAC